MDVDTYNAIVSSIRTFKGLSYDCIKSLKLQFPHVNKDTLFSIMENEYQIRMKHNYCKKDTLKTKYWNRYLQALENLESPGILLRFSQESDVTPCLIAKLILQSYFESLESNSDDIKINVNHYLRNTSLIPDMDLAYEVFLCVNMDNLYSPLIDASRQTVGQQYEIRLYNELKKKNIAFRHEEDLRTYGYDKTPDFKLEVPIAIDGFIVNWVESKARFGSSNIHQEYNDSQFLSYWNRFGSGLVIYWFGYVQNIVDQDNKKYIVRDSLPDKIFQLNCGKNKNNFTENT